MGKENNSKSDMLHPVQSIVVFYFKRLSIIDF